jgi:hypothetical protein
MPYHKGEEGNRMSHRALARATETKPRHEPPRVKHGTGRRHRKGGRRY